MDETSPSAVPLAGLLRNITANYRNVTHSWNWNGTQSSIANDTHNDFSGGATPINISRREGTGDISRASQRDRSAALNIRWPYRPVSEYGDGKSRLANAAAGEKHRDGILKYCISGFLSVTAILLLM